MPNVLRTALSGVPVAAAFAACTFGTAARPAPLATHAATQLIRDAAAAGAGGQYLYEHKLGRIAPDLAVDSADALREADLDALEQLRGAIDAATRQQVIDGAIEQMQRGYIFEDVAAKMAAALRAHAKAGDYDAITDGADFAAVLTTHLREVSRDKHLRILYDPAGIAGVQPPTSDAERARRAAAERRGNYGLHRVERLDGNVGYIELRGFSGSQEAGAAVDAAMNLLANTDALIFDLRRNGGGSPVTIGFIASYLFDKPVHLNDFYVRETGRRQSFHTAATVYGRRYGERKPVYILTSNRTFSAAEEFTYDLKNLKRAIVVGETTGGGAHPGGVRPLTDHFGIWLPTGRAINPVTGTNWEGVGVVPDIAADAAEALPAAHLDALRKIRATVSDPDHRNEIDRAIAALEGKPRG